MITGQDFIMQNGTIYVAIPAMNEAAWLPRTIDLLLEEPTEYLRILVCVNQPDSWWDDPQKQEICLNNRETLAYLEAKQCKKLRVIDCSSRGKGWQGKHFGVGQARKVLMDVISSEANPGDVMISMDADSLFDPGYTLSVYECFKTQRHALALSNPYYHRLTGDERLDRAMLRYEIYMRYYAINMWRIGSPYSFTAIGSSMALPVNAYRTIGGITAKKSGEDFYFLQKLRKTGWICNDNTHLMYPATRYSDRVFFGTGPALIKGSQGEWDSYPIYSHYLFDRVKTSYDHFSQLYAGYSDFPMADFLRKQFREDDPFAALRKNAGSKEQFIQASHQKVDGLRVLQFLKSEQKQLPQSDEKHLEGFLKEYYPGLIRELSVSDREKQTAPEPQKEFFSRFGFHTAPVLLLDQLRNSLMEIERSYQRNDANKHV
ncbi:MAG: glycosyltransferase [Bacteroidia bacterium]|nr:MAG: glycosyltransferase [Bacteroidia bacterium]